MFTLNQIKAAHGKVKSGADFPQYVQDLIALGVTKYDTFVRDGYSQFFGQDGSLSSSAKYESLAVADESNANKFSERLKLHQNGSTDYPTFCNDAAINGVEKWTVDTVAMTCIYYDKAGNILLTENIPTTPR